ncbi:MAG: hypothetical protein U0835_22140 [Isosphaeraceae bacterium]
MSTPPRNEGGPARELLVGLLAYQNGFVSREALLLAVGAWAGDRSRSIGAHLTGQGPLDPARLALLEALADEHQRLHGGDPEKSLATLGSSVDPVMSDLSRAVGEDLQPSIALVGRDRAAPGAGPVVAPDGRRFRILKLHAQGGLGRVYEAQDEELGRTVALKEIQPDKADRHDLRSRFVLEAEINGGLQHPGIVPVYSLGHYDGGKPFYAMRFVEGASLRDAVARHHEARSNPDPSTKEFRDLLNPVSGRVQRDRLRAQQGRAAPGFEAPQRDDRELWGGVDHRLGPRQGHGETRRGQLRRSGGRDSGASLGQRGGGDAA